MTVKHPEDVRANDQDPPCVICGQPEAKHPTAADFHKYQRPAKPADAKQPPLS